MNVLFVTRWYPGPGHLYAGTFVREHAKAVRAAGHGVAVLHVPGQPDEGRGAWQMVEETDPALTEEIPTFHVYCRATSIPHLSRISRVLTYWRYVWSAYRSARRLRSSGFDPDVIHGHVFSAGPPAVLIARLFRRRLVITEHVTLFPRGTMTRGGRKVAAFAFGRAARVLPVCAFLQRAIESYGIRARFTVVPNAVNTSIFFRAEGARPSGPTRMLFVGNLEATHHKGFPELVEALAALHTRRRGWHLDVVGGGPTQPEYERLVTEAGLADSIAFHGSKPKADVAALMRASDLFVLPSRFENLPCVIIEAMTSGLPVVATGVGGIPEMVSEADGILVSPQDPVALADALDRALSTLGSFDRTAIADRARARFSLEAVGKQLATIYEEIARR